MSLTVEQVRAGCAWQSDLCRKNASPTYVAILTELSERLGHDRELTELLTGEDQDPIRSAQCLRLLGAVTRVAAAESAGWIGEHYPTFGGKADPAAATAAFFDFLAAHLPAVRAQMDISVQTNEVGRSAPVSAALNHVARLTGQPLRLLEVGASAGLNLLIDRYRVESGHDAWGPADSPLRLAGHFVEGRPPAAEPAIVERRGCDLNPIDVHAPASADLLRSFIWPDHVERRSRLDSALDVARALPPLRIDAADAVGWITDQLAELPSGVTTVVYHTIVLTYFDATARAAFADRIRTRGAATTEDAPLAWISMEPSAEDSSVVELICELWPSGQRVLLARTTPHGTQVRWDPQELPA